MQAKTDAKAGADADNLRKSKDEGGTMQSQETTLAETEHKAHQTLSSKAGSKAVMQQLKGRGYFSGGMTTKDQHRPSFTFLSKKRAPYTYVKTNDAPPVALY